MRHRRTAAVATLVAATLLLSPASSAARAGSDIVVTTTTDSLAVDGACSLREAVRAVDLGHPIDACPSGDAIDLGPGTYALAIPGVAEDAGLTGDLDVTRSVTISGAGPDRTILDARGLDRFFDVHPGTKVRIQNVTVTGGWVDWDTARSNGGGISNSGDLILRRVAVRGNGAFGAGGVYSDGDLTIRDSTIERNASPFSAGGIGATGTVTIQDTAILSNQSGSNDDVAAGLFVDGHLRLLHSLVAGNSATGEWAVGGVSMTGGDVIGSTIRDNGTSSCGAGGIRMVRSTLDSTTVSGNRGGYCSYAGGVVAIDSTIVNSTVSGNTVGEGWGYAIGAGGVDATGTRIVQSTISGNENRYAPEPWDPGRRPVAAAGLVAESGDGTSVAASIVSGNVGPWTDCDGPAISANHNLIGTNAACALSASDLRGAPRLGPLADNGGPTWTQLPLPGSPAIDAFDCDRGCPNVDQRGVHRPQDGDADGSRRWDIGAVEVRRP